MATLNQIHEMQSVHNNINNILTHLNTLMPGAEGVGLDGLYPGMSMPHVGMSPMGHMCPMTPPQHVMPPVPQVGVRHQQQQQQPQGPYKMGRVALGDIQANTPEKEESPMKALLERERQQRQQIQRMAMTESARLEMNIQNINIKKNSQKAIDGLPHTPNHHGEDAGGPKTCEREENADGTIKYDFSTGLPGGVCVYFMKGYCGIGNKCRYVHDPNDAGTVVKITGMPYTSTVEQVIDFFAPLEISKDKVTFLLSREGKQTGSAFIEFGSRKDALFALGKDRNFINEHRFVLLYPSSYVERAWFCENPMPFSAHVTPSQTKKRQASPSMKTPPSVGTPGQLPNSQVLSQLQNLHMLQQQQHQQQQLLDQMPPSPFRFGGLPMVPNMNMMSPVGHMSPVPAMPMVMPMHMTMPNPSTPGGMDACHKDDVEARVTPVKQLQFDETDEPAAGKGDLLSDLTRKLRNPNTLGNLPPENLKIVLKSMGYSDDSCTSLVRDIQRSCGSKGTGLPPLVPMSKAA
eukprot:TRINITY_DN12443_c2_g1_i1.p1 TRINITY_DN12443_c2_g1~~TRINITY_DN12443_c2_g1_i1.p1  ORF type:complete len:536 (+),score=169.73 TRINITY_DN12443_c2_g1_i1:59-1609(+)